MIYPDVAGGRVERRADELKASKNLTAKLAVGESVL